MSEPKALVPKNNWEMCEMLEAGKECAVPLRHFSSVIGALDYFNIKAVLEVRDTYAACILWTVLLAVWSAVDDAEQIAAGERLNKPLQWLARAFGVTAFCVACGLWWMALPMGALFSSVFRFVLNRRRGLDWRYVSPSSWYDWQFLRLTWRPYDRANLQAAWRKEWNAPQTVDAGALAYTAEVMVVVCAVIWMT